MGSRKGSDVAQVYVAELDSAQEPPAQLKTFEKLFLNPGQSKTVRIEIPLDRLEAWSKEIHDCKLWKDTYGFIGR